MKAYKVTILIVDHDELGAADIKVEMENTNFANDCLRPHVMEVEEADIGEWTGEHPLNQTATMYVAYEEIFKKASK